MLCGSFCSKCASIHCSEIGRPWIFLKHVITPLHMAEKPQPAVHTVRSRSHYHDFLGYAGSLTLSKLSKASPLRLSSQPRLTHVPGLQAGKGEHVSVTGTLSPIQRRRPRGKEERKIYTMSTSLLYVVIYSLYPTQSSFRSEDSSTFNRTVSCLQSRLVFSEGSQTWMSSRWFFELVLTEISDCDSNFKRNAVFQINLCMVRSFIIRFSNQNGNRKT